MILYLLVEHDISNQKHTSLPWILLKVVLLVPFIAWAENRNWRFSGLNALSIFPLLGLWAWSIMWTHYIYGSVRILKPSLIKDEHYSKITEWVVLALILLHPGLLMWQQWKTRRMLPPGSFYNYVDSSLKLFILIGSLSLLIFLAFDVLKRLRKLKIIDSNWRWISLSQAIAMSLIFIHSIALGRTINEPWFEFYWVVLGALLIPCFGLILRSDWQTNKRA